MFNDITVVLSDVPPTLAAGWAVWFGAGVLLAMWSRKAKANLEIYQAMATRTVARAKSGPRQASSLAEPRAIAEPRPAAVAAPRSKPSPIVVGDPFGDLATLLDQPTAAAPPAPVFRAPGESPILNSAGSPILRNNDPEPKF